MFQQLPRSLMIQTFQVLQEPFYLIRIPTGLTYLTHTKYVWFH